MALTLGNKSYYNSNPGGASFSWSHTQNTGADGALIVILNIPAASVSGVTYAGAAMTLVRQEYTAYSTYWSVWKKVGPATGANTVAVTVSLWNPCSGAAYSFTGCSGVGATSFNNVQATGQTTSLTIAANSMVLAMATSGTAGTAIEIPSGTGRTIDFNHNFSNYHFGGISPALSSGSVTVKGTASATNIIMAVEIQEAASAAAPTVTTLAATNITTTSGQMNMNIGSNGGAAITSWGVYYGSTSNPTTQWVFGTTDVTGSYGGSATGIAPGFTVYYKAYATNSVGTSYGSVLNFTTISVTPQIMTNLFRIRAA